MFSVDLWTVVTVSPLEKPVLPLERRGAVSVRKMKGEKEKKIQLQTEINYFFNRDIGAVF